MAKVATPNAKMTKSQIAAALAEQSGISKKQSTLFLENLAQLAYKQAKNTFTIPGIGKLKLKDVPARDVVLRFPPERAGQIVHKEKSKKLRFTIAKAAKEAVLGKKK